MMKAKDTVMSEKEMVKHPCWPHDTLGLLKAQDKISFKAGVEHCREQNPEPWDAEEVIFKDGKNAGTKEVVEWIKDTDIMIMLSPRKRREWQAKLNKWEIKNE